MSRKPYFPIKALEADPKSETVRKLAVTLWKKGAQIPGTRAFDYRPEFYCDDPQLIHRHTAKSEFWPMVEVTQTVPCRVCDKCRQFRQMQWRERALHEIMSSKRTWFVTLTFSDTHLAGVRAESALLAGPDDERRLDKAAYKHLQRFFKRLRRAAPKGSLRFLAVFELGSKTARAHYHLLLHEVGERPFTKRTIERQWRSNVHARLVDVASPFAATYVTKYLTKSIISPRASRLYGKGRGKQCNGEKDPSVKNNGTSL